MSAWPFGCTDRDSCARHGACQYARCQHQDRDIRPEIMAAQIEVVRQEVVKMKEGE
jgi:hypothetical protein